MTRDESVNNVLKALYQSSSTIKIYVDTVLDGKPIPYTILTKSTTMEENELFVDDVMKICENVRLTGIPSCMDDETAKMHVELNAKMVVVKEIEALRKVGESEGEEYEVVMFKDDAVVEGSRQVISDVNRIQQLKEYAEFKGYEFSARKVHD